MGKRIQKEENRKQRIFSYQPIVFQSKLMLEDSSRLDLNRFSLETSPVQGHVFINVGDVCLQKKHIGQASVNLCEDLWDSSRICLEET